MKSAECATGIRIILAEWFIGSKIMLLSQTKVTRIDQYRRQWTDDTKNHLHTVCKFRININRSDRAETYISFRIYRCWLHTTKFSAWPFVRRAMLGSSPGRCNAKTCEIWQGRAVSARFAHFAWVTRAKPCSQARTRIARTPMRVQFMCNSSRTKSLTDWFEPRWSSFLRPGAILCRLTHTYPFSLSAIFRPGNVAELINGKNSSSWKRSRAVNGKMWRPMLHKLSAV